MCYLREVKLHNTETVEPEEGKLSRKKTCDERSLEDSLTSANSLRTTAQPSRRHLSSVQERRQEPSLWFNQLEREDDLVQRLLHICGENETRRRETADSAPPASTLRHQHTAD